MGNSLYQFSWCLPLRTATHSKFISCSWITHTFFRCRKHSICCVFLYKYRNSLRTKLLKFPILFFLLLSKAPIFNISTVKENVFLLTYIRAVLKRMFWITFLVQLNFNTIYFTLLMFLLYFMQINLVSIKDFQKHLKNLTNPKLLIISPCS